MRQNPGDTPVHNAGTALGTLTYRLRCMLRKRRWFVNRSRAIPSLSTVAFLLHLLLGIAFAPTAWAGLLLQWLQSHVMPTLLIDPTDGTIVDANGAAKAENRNDFVFPHRLADGRVSEIHGLVHDVTKEMHLTEALERIAYHDPLTGLANRNGLVAGPSKRSHAASQKKNQASSCWGCSTSTNSRRSISTTGLCARIRDREADACAGSRGVGGVVHVHSQNYPQAETCITGNHPATDRSGSHWGKVDAQIMQ